MLERIDEIVLTSPAIQALNHLVNAALVRYSRRDRDMPMYAFAMAEKEKGLEDGRVVELVVVLEEEIEEEETVLDEFLGTSASSDVSAGNDKTEQMAMHSRRWRKRRCSSINGTKMLKSF